MKPVAPVERAIRNSSKSRDVVLDPFGGSGSTLIACEKTGRQARLVELDPKYCEDRAALAGLGGRAGDAGRLRADLSWNKSRTPLLTLCRSRPVHECVASHTSFCAKYLRVVRCWRLHGPKGGIRKVSLPYTMPPFRCTNARRLNVANPASMENPDGSTILSG
jgi:hypothetical protein